MKVLIACDKFKGSLSAIEACEAIAAGLPQHECELCPIADGGEGFVEAILGSTSGEKVLAQCRDALGREVAAEYALLDDGSAVIEMSAASGLWRIDEPERDPLFSNTYGTGQLMRHAIEKGATRLLIGIGGSATNDGGVGMAEALGVTFKNADGKTILPVPATFAEIASIDLSGILELPPMTVACDVTNPLLGPSGATAIFGPQKGAQPEQLPQLEAALAHLTTLFDCQPDFPGAGAAGGLGFGLRHFCKAELVSGFDLVAQALHLAEKVAAADLVITGEGSLDAQSLDGKGPTGIAKLARAAGKEVIGIAGHVSEEARPLFDQAYALSSLDLPLETLMKEAGPLLTTMVRTKLK
ncbi:glycerate kinase [Akkermansiaceae bacterium]|nr:glycerate kinase [Akkermansiaceae bacterium]